MKSKNLRISMLKTWISRNPEGRAKLTKLHQTMKQENKEIRNDYQY